MQVASIAACLPEQLNRTRDSGPSGEDGPASADEARISRRAVASSSGSDGGHCRSSAVSPA
jgi:hypothetical protein